MSAGGGSLASFSFLGGGGGREERGWDGHVFVVWMTGVWMMGEDTWMWHGQDRAGLVRMVWYGREVLESSRDVPRTTSRTEVGSAKASSMNSCGILGDGSFSMARQIKGAAGQGCRGKRRKATLRFAHGDEAERERRGQGRCIDGCSGAGRCKSRRVKTGGQTGVSILYLLRKADLMGEEGGR